MWLQKWFCFAKENPCLLWASTLLNLGWREGGGGRVTVAKITWIKKPFHSRKPQIEFFADWYRGGAIKRRDFFVWCIYSLKYCNSSFFVQIPEIHHALYGLGLFDRSSLKSEVRRFLENRLSPMLWEPFKDTAPTHRCCKGAINTFGICYQKRNVHFKPRILLFSAGNGAANAPRYWQRRNKRSALLDTFEKKCFRSLVASTITPHLPIPTARWISFPRWQFVSKLSTTAWRRIFERLSQDGGQRFL